MYQGPNDKERYQARNYDPTKVVSQHLHHQLTPGGRRPFVFVECDQSGEAIRIVLTDGTGWPEDLLNQARESTLNFVVVPPPPKVAP